MLDYRYEFAHHVPGRLRVRCPRIKRDEREAARVTAVLSELDGVTRVEASVVTGSIVVVYDTDTVPGERILSLMDCGGAPAPRQSQGLDDLVQSAASRSAGRVAKAVIGYAIEQMLQRSATMLIAAVL
jgi:copper chaperone CopZ